jgi:hypothetical protein
MIFLMPKLLLPSPPSFRLMEVNIDRILSLQLTTGISNIINAIGMRKTPVNFTFIDAIGA